MLSTILRVGIDHVTVGSEQFMEPRLDKKAGVLDIKAVAVDGRAFDIEMQAIKTGNPPRRARLYQALVDSELLDKGGECASLPGSS